MRPRQIDVFGMCEKNVPELKMGTRLDPRRRLEIEDRLQTLYARFNIRRARGPKVFC